MRGLALSPDNNLYISNCWSHSILRVHKKSADTTLLADRKLFFRCFRQYIYCLGASDLDFPRFFRFYRDRMIVTEEFNSAVKIFIVEGQSLFSDYRPFWPLREHHLKTIFRNKQRWFEYGNEQC